MSGARTMSLVVVALLAGCSDDAAPVDAGPRGVDAGPETDAGAGSDGGGGDAGAPECGPDRLAWSTVAPLPEPRESHGALLHAGRLHVFGGWSGAAATDTAFHAALDRNGAPGEWEPGPRLPVALERPAAVAHGDRVYLIGGDDGVSAALDAVLGGTVAPSGAVEGWEALSAVLPAPRVGHAAVVVGDHVFVMGGATAIGGGAQRAVLVSALGPDGPTGWSTTSALASLAPAASAVTDGTRIWLASGATLQVAEVGAGGALGAWEALPDIDGAAPSLELARSAGALFAIGGLASGVGRDDVFAAELDGAGDLGAWAPRPVLPGPRFGHRIVATDAHLVVTGGWISMTAGVSDTVFVGALCD